ncbi:MAG: MFS transporter [Muribaculaceae bacterium]|nr:MFS transporter [Muribaculaceae bacterium]
MKYVSDGRGALPLISLIALLSVSLTVNLPGLAVSPLLGKLADLFPHASRLELQLLTLLPNLVIIPMILVSGKITNVRNQTAILAIGLSIFLISGILYFFADSMPLLVGLGALLGIGCGLIVPIAAGLLSEWFYGDQKAKVLGFKSGTSNGIVILATIFVGWAAGRSWHDAFLVYLVPIIPLLLLPFMTNSFIKGHLQEGKSDGNDAKTKIANQQETPEVRFKRPLLMLGGVILLYIGLTATSMVFTYYLPFTMKHYGLSTSQVGVATAMFYVTAMIGGFSLTPYVRLLGRTALYGCILIMTAGLLVMGFMHTMSTYIIGVLLIGLGYGFFQPIIYNKTTQLAPNKEASTKYFSYTLTGNYVAIACLPVVVEFFQWVFDNHSANFPYFLNAGILGVIFIIGILKRKSFVWKTGK